eukprot:gene31930-38605_t
MSSKKKTKKQNLVDFVPASQPTPLAARLPASTAPLKAQLHPNALRNLQTLEPKRHVYKKKRKKGLSSLKKKILTERLQHFRISRAAQEKERLEKGTDIKEDVIQKERGDREVENQYVCVYNLVDDSVDLQDEDERLEIMENIQEILRPFGPIHCISIWHVTAPRSAFVVKVRYWQSSVHRQVVQVLQGFLVAGEKLELELHEDASAHPVEIAASSAGGLGEFEVSPLPQDLSVIPAVANVLCLLHLFSEDDVQDAEELQEGLRDIVELLAGRSLEAHLTRLEVFAGVRDCGVCVVLHFSDVLAAQAAQAYLHHLLVAQQQLECLPADQMAKGDGDREGFKVATLHTAAVHDEVQIENVKGLEKAPDVSLPQDSELRDQDRDRGQCLYEEFYPAPAVSAAAEPVDEKLDDEDADAAQLQDEEQRPGKLPPAPLVEGVPPCHLTKDSLNIVTTPGLLPRYTSRRSKKSVTVFNPPSRVVNFGMLSAVTNVNCCLLGATWSLLALLFLPLVAKEIATCQINNPRLGFEVTDFFERLELYRSNNPGVVAEGPILDALKALCKLLATYQLKLKDKERDEGPSGATKKKLRFVTGTKQCLQSVKSQRAKLLVLATDIESSPPLLSLLDEITRAAQTNNIPVLYGPNRRALGKALKAEVDGKVVGCGGGIRPSVLCILDPQGGEAYEKYRTLIKWIEEGAGKK